MDHNVLKDFEEKIKKARQDQMAASQRVEELEQQKEEYIRKDRQQNIITDIAIGVAENILENYSSEYPEYDDKVRRRSTYRDNETEREMKVRVLNNDYQINIDTNTNTIILDRWWADELSNTISLSIKIDPYEPQS